MKNTYLYWGLVIVVFAVAVALRSVEVLNKNYLFGFDHGRDYLAAYSIAELGKPTLIGAEVGAGFAGLSGLFHGPGYFYLIALMYKLWNGDPFGGLLIMYVFGITALVLTFVTTRKMMGDWEALLATFLVGISPLIVSQSRFMWNHHLTTPFIVLSFYFVYKADKKPGLFAPLAMLTSALIYHFELGMAVPMVLGMLLSFALIYRISSLKTWVLSFGALVIGFAPMIAFEARHGFMATRGMITYLFGGVRSAAGPAVSAGAHIRNYLDNARNTFVTEGGFFPDNWYTPLAVGLLIFAGFYIWKSKDKALAKLTGFMLILLGVSYGMFFMLNNTIWDYYLIHAHIVYIYVFVLAFFWAVKRKKQLIWLGISVALSLFLLSGGAGTIARLKVIYTQDLHDVGGAEKIVGKKAAIDALYADARGKPFNVLIFMPPIYTYPYDYLFLTYGKKKYGYSPGTEKKGTVYLIIEEDKSQPWRSKGWLETVVNGGTVTGEWTLPTGQKIIRKEFI